MRKLILSALAAGLLVPAAFAQKTPVKAKAVPAKKATTAAPATASTGKLDRSKKPKPGPAPIINLAKAEQWTLDNGLKVFFVRDTKLPRIAYQLTLDYDPIFEGEAAGYVSVAGDLIGTGTQSMTKDQLDEEVDFMGASLGTSSNGVYGSGLSRYAEHLMELMGDVITKPRMDSTEMERLKTRMISGIVANKTDPSTISRRVVNKLMYGPKHPYGEFETEETVKKVTLKKCKEFYSKFYRPNIGYLAIVGDITSADAHRLVQKSLGGWQKADVPTASYYEFSPPTSNYVAVVDRPASVQSVINISAPVNLKMNNPDLIKARMMNDVLGGGSSARLFNNLREKHGYTYGAYSSLQPNKLIGNFSASASVRTPVTDSSITQFLIEMKRISTEAVADTELVLTRNGVSGNFINSLESPQTVANFAINIALYGLPQDYYQNYLKNVAAVTKQDIQTLGGRYVKPTGNYIVVVGNAQEISDKLKQFGEVHFLNDYGDPVAPNFLNPAAPGTTVQTVLDKYIKAVGGKADFEKIKDYTTVYAGDLQGNPLEVENFAKRPNKTATVVRVGPMEVQRSGTNGTASVTSSQGQVKKEEGKDLQDEIAKSYFGWELDPAKAGITGRVLGQEKVNGKEAVKVEFKYASGNTWTEHFDATTGLRLRETTTEQSPQGPVISVTDYSDYKPVKGTKFLVPGKIMQPVGPMKIEMTLKDSKANSNLKDSLFDVK